MFPRTRLLVFLAILPVLAAIPASGQVQLLANPDFETPPFAAGWVTSAASTAGLNGSAQAARLPFNGTASLNQALAEPKANFTFDFYVQSAGVVESQSFRAALDAGGQTAVEVRGTDANALQLKIEGTWITLLRKTDAARFTFPANQTVRIRIVGRGFGSTGASYDVAWSNPNSTALSHAAGPFTRFASSALPSAGVSHVRFDRNLASAHSYTIDDVTLLDAAQSVPAADYEVVADKVIRISGVYPHLAMTNSAAECGVGAVVPWAGRLWTLTYSPHLPNGSDDKLYEIFPSMQRVIRPESIGGTPANRFIHLPSQQLNIGPYFIDASGHVRVLPYSVAPGRHTATAAHLTDPENRLYIFTMEDGLYDIDVHTLGVTTIYPDVQGTGDAHLSGYHGKGAYTGQGRVVVANNGEPGQTYPSGVLATWDGTMPHDWQEIYRVQHCEVTGPGGLSGNANPATDPVWATGFDQKSVVLRAMENGVWQTWRLPKGSYTHDAAHGWNTEWPRIREVSPGTWLMHMHGLFFQFPATFSAANFSGLTPLCAYEKMPVDYCTFNGELVIAKNDASRINNAFVPRSQSNLWFGQLSDLQKWGAPHGHGSMWLNEAVANGAVSEPFLVNGFAQGTLHLRNESAAEVSIDLERSTGDGAWSLWRTVTVPAQGYLPESINDHGTQWLRLRARAASTRLTAAFLLFNSYRHATPASVATDRYAALADIRDQRSFTDGLIRVMAGADLRLEMASARTNASGASAASGYHQSSGSIQLQTLSDSTAESSVRSGIATTTAAFGFDAASAWVPLTTGSSVKLRLPKLDPGYETPFGSGWARAFREIVTEREMLNCHGTFYQVPRNDAGGRRKLKPIASHGKRITDYASWRGLLALTGVLDSAPASESLLRTASGDAALWLGEVDDLWQMGEPRGYGGPWLGTSVTANTASDAYLMYGYDRKELRLSHQSASSVNFTVQVDFLGDNTWSTYQVIAVAPGETVSLTFPTGFHAHWVRLLSSAATVATAQFTYGPADRRDAFLDWARDAGLPTGAGRHAVATADRDADGSLELMEFIFGQDPATPDRPELEVAPDALHALVRELPAAGGITLTPEVSDDLLYWAPRPDMELPGVNQAGVPPGFTLRSFSWAAGDQSFLRLRGRLSTE